MTLELLFVIVFLAWIITCGILAAVERAAKAAKVAAKREVSAAVKAAVVPKQMEIYRLRAENAFLACELENIKDELKEVSF